MVGGIFLSILRRLMTRRQGNIMTMHEIIIPRPATSLPRIRADFRPGRTIFTDMSATAQLTTRILRDCTAGTTSCTALVIILIT